MMDHMSEQPGPTAEAAVAWAMRELKNEATALGISRLAHDECSEYCTTCYAWWITFVDICILTYCTWVALIYWVFRLLDL